MKTILVIEDDRELSHGICYALRKEAYAPMPAYSLKEAKDTFSQNKADLILLDVNLPDGEGFSFCGWVRAQENSQAIPVLFLTARDLEEDALKGYELGGDDYITKPFSMKILLKKIDVALKRMRTAAGEEASRAQGSNFDDGFLRIDFDKAKVEAGGQERSVTPTEFRLLRELVEHKGKLLTYSVLLERLWDSAGQFVDKHALAVNVNRLRGKIEDQDHKYISNVYGMGYQWLD
ncbi:MAG: response regulator transcription factor [Firmicutes bacterium]|jgi:DNA-binding response OmpR family regulator|nr:response regulator transcription factor [Bacillota bacterium]NBI62189.1 DNA-binding response regulator [Clostridiales bacterium]